MWNVDEKPVPVTKQKEKKELLFFIILYTSGRRVQVTEPGVREKGIRLSSTKVLTDYSSRNRVVPAPRDSTGKTRRELVGIILYPHTPLHLTEPAAPGAINSRSRVCVNVFQTSQLFILCH